MAESEVFRRLTTSWRIRQVPSLDGVVVDAELGDLGLLKDLADDGLDSLDLVVNRHDARKASRRIWAQSIRMLNR